MPKVMKHVFLFSAAVFAAACSNAVNQDDFTGYDDIISYVVEGYQSGWEGMTPEEMALSNVYCYCSPYGGFAKKDIDGDGVEELMLGDCPEAVTYQIYDIMKYDMKTGNVEHLFKGGERDWCVINTDGILIEKGSSSAFDSFTKYYEIDGLRMKEINDKTASEDLMQIDFEKFADYAFKDICGGFTSLREVTPEDRAVFDDAVEGSEEYVLIAVATQIVNGTNYRFLCKREGERCWVRIYKPLVGPAEVMQ